MSLGRRNLETAALTLEDKVVGLDALGLAKLGWELEGLGLD